MRSLKLAQDGTTPTHGDDGACGEQHVLGAHCRALSARCVAPNRKELSMGVRR